MNKTWIGFWLSLAVGSCWGSEVSPTVELARAQNELGLDVLRTLHEPGVNACVSPVSLGVALSMAAEGAEGRTLAELLKALRADGATLGARNRALLSALQGRSGTSLRIANSVWTTQKSGALLPAFAQSMARNFKAEARAVDLRDPATLDVINGWVGRATEGRIPRILDSVEPNTAAFLINALAFQAEWTSPFTSGTYEAKFRLHDGGQHPVQLMGQRAEFACLEDGGSEIVRLPYGKDGLAHMWIALPAKGGLPKLVSELNQESLSRWTAEAKLRDCGVSLPRFSLKSKLELKSVLQALGVADAFDPKRADFSRLSGQGEDLYVNRVLQELRVDVTEKGTEAAAATVVELGVEGGAQPEFSLYCDRPFAFVIQDAKSEAVLFAGAVYAP